jgi:hypothetical protein
MRRAAKSLALHYQTVLPPQKHAFIINGSATESAVFSGKERASCQE